MTNYEQKAYDALAMKLTEAGYAYENTSWGNDATASISVTCTCLLYTSPSPRDGLLSRMPSSA